MHKSSWLQKWARNTTIFQRQVCYSVTQSSSIRRCTALRTFDTKVKHTVLVISQYLIKTKSILSGAIDWNRAVRLSFFSRWFDRIRQWHPLQMEIEASLTLWAWLLHLSGHSDWNGFVSNLRDEILLLGPWLSVKYRWSKRQFLLYHNLVLEHIQLQLDRQLYGVKTLQNQKHKVKSWDDKTGGVWWAYAS